jgi:phage/plasmid-associated DNA primase
LLFDLLRLDLSKINLRQAPRTAALFEQKLRSLESIESWWNDRLSEGSPGRIFDHWPELVSVDVVYADYVRTCEEVGVRRKRDRSTFGLKLAQLVPGIEKTRPRVETEGGGNRRVWSYSLPSLEDCRTSFEQLMGQPITWPAISSGEIGPPAPEMADQEIPV